jgi:Ca-activated chloride channel family protein
MVKDSARAILALVAMLALAAGACLGTAEDDEDSPPRGSVPITVAANSSLSPWLAAAADQFNAAEVETAGEDPVYVQLMAVESGQAVADISAGAVTADLWLPEEPVWTSVLADQGNTAFTGDCRSVATSPLVIAMWRPVAQSLGWPGLPIGWLDVGSLAADPTAWAYYSGGQYGDALRLGHTHPGLSGSGASTLLALVQAAESTTEAVTSAEIQEPIVQASVSAFEGAVSWFSSATEALAAEMSSRGSGFLGAAVMYESDVVHHGNGEIVPIYPFEGTFVASHPACVNGSAEAESQEAARLFRDYLLGAEGQQLAVSFGLRPIGGAQAGPPLDEAHGVDLGRPEVVFDSPTVETIYAVQDLWQAARKPVNLVMLIDVSGSMGGDKIDNVRRAAAEFVRRMGDEDFLTVVPFNHEVLPVTFHEHVGESRERILELIEGLEAWGDTALYDAVGDGATYIGQTTSPETTNALVVLSDGQDTYSYRYSFGKELMDLAAANDTTVFAIAYGDDADEDILTQLATGANGSFFQGDEASISDIYEEMSAAFGGSVGVGR